MVKMRRSNHSEKKSNSAVALKYEPKKDSAPKVTAKGRGAVAEKIVQIARENGVSIHEDPLLVEILGQIDIGREIPPELYQVIAEILAFVYQLDAKMRNVS